MLANASILGQAHTEVWICTDVDAGLRQHDAVNYRMGPV